MGSKGKTIREIINKNISNNALPIVSKRNCINTKILFNWELQAITKMMTMTDDDSGDYILLENCLFSGFKALPRVFWLI